jgi:cell division septum initiation protein DivIVA
MSYTPVELRHVHIGRRLFGYNRAMVEQVIEEVAESFEVTWRERGELGDQVDALQKQVAELRRREDLLTHTLVAAEQAASDIRDHAKREAESMLTEAQTEARSIARAAQDEHERLQVESRRITAMLRGALSMVDGSAVEAAAEPEPLADESPSPLWRREDTREFEPIRLPPVAELPSLEDVPEPQPFLQRLAGRNARDLDWGD